MDSRHLSSEEIPLVSGFRRTKLQRTLEALGYGGSIALNTFDKTVNSVNALAVLEAVLLTFLAFPKIDGVVNHVLNPWGILLILSALGIDIAASRKQEFSIGSSIFKFENIKQKFGALVDSTNTYYFSLMAAIAVYIAADAAINNIGENEVDVSNLVYITAFIVPAMGAAAVHAFLKSIKDNWENSETNGAKWMRRTNHALTTLYNGSNLNSFLMLILTSAWGVSEGNHANPYDRLGLFGVAFLAGLILSITAANSKSSVKHIERFINTICAVSYLSTSVGPNAREANGNTMTNLFIATYALTAVTSFISALIGHKANMDIPAPSRAINDDSFDIERAVSEFVQIGAESLEARALADRNDAAQVGDVEPEVSRAVTPPPRESVLPISVFNRPKTPPVEIIAPAPKQTLQATGTDASQPVVERKLSK